MHPGTLENNKKLPSNNHKNEETSLDLITNMDSDMSILGSQMFIKPVLEIFDEPFEGADKLISVAVDSDVHVRDLIREISDLAKIDINIDPSIDGRMIMKVHDRKVSDIFKQIADKVHIRYYVEDGIVYFVRDDPFIKHYRLDLLNIVRNANNTFDVNTKVLGSADESGNENVSGASGSSNNIKVEYKDDIWNSIKSDLEEILSKYDALYSSIDNYQRSFGGAFIEKVNNVNDDSAVSKANIENNSKIIINNMPSSVSISKQSGIITIFTSYKSHNEVAKYIDKIRRKLNSQVLIEAKVVEVSLKDVYSTGIDWTVYDPNNLNNVADRDNFQNSRRTAFGIDPASALETAQEEKGGFRWKSIVSLLENNSISANLNWLQVFGETRIVSSPRISTINNQQAVISFVKNFVYFDTKVTEEDIDSNDSNNTTADTRRFTVDSTIKTVPVGIILSLQPSIDLENGEISLNLRPSISRIVDNVQNPATEYAIAKSGITTELRGASNVPVIEVRTMDSMVRVKNGGVMAIGGLHERRIENKDNGMPVLGKLPVIGNLFKTSSKQVEEVETVILIKATIREDGHNADQFSIKHWSTK
ncbi:hypothetical protein [Candidatus Xenohaliotis californiensis]